MASSDLQACGWRDWASLGSGPVVLIAERVFSNDYVDFLRFRATCRAWRNCSSAAPRPHGALDRQFFPRRWIMLPRRSTSSNDDVTNDRQCCFLDVATGGSIRLSLPSLHHCYVFGRTTEDLLVLCRKSDYIMQLLNPLTGQIADLPHADTLLGLSLIRVTGPDWHPPYWNTDTKLNKLKLHGAGLVDGSTVTLHFEDFSLAIAKPGEESWTRLNFKDKIFSALPFAGCIYYVTMKNISVVEIMAYLPDQSPEPVEAINLEVDSSVHLEDPRCLLNIDGELVLACRAWSTTEPSAYGSYRAYRVKLDTRKLVPLVRLNGQAFFSGSCHSLLVSTGVSRSIVTDTMYVCYTGQAKVVALDLDGGCIEHKFEEEDTAAYLSSYVCTAQD